MGDCEHWIPFFLEAEREERRKLERENRELRNKLAAIGDMVRDVRRPEQTRQEFHKQAQLGVLQIQALEAARPSESCFGGLLGGGAASIFGRL